MLLKKKILLPTDNLIFLTNHFNIYLINLTQGKTIHNTLKSHSANNSHEIHFKK